MNFPLIELLGWLAAGLVLLSFSLKTMVALRVAAICSNVVFFGYGLMADLLDSHVRETLAEKPAPSQQAVDETLALLRSYLK